MTMVELCHKKNGIMEAAGTCDITSNLFYKLISVSSS
jgi:hypothetical protein